jgi:hypothetical protein
VFEECIKTLHLKCLDRIKYFICEAKQEFFYVIYIRWILNMSILWDCKIQNFEEFRDIYGGIPFFNKNSGPSSSKGPNKPFFFGSFIANL